MTNKIHKEDAGDPNEGEVKPKKYQRPERHIKRVDYQRIEEAPLGKLQHEIQKKLAVIPSASDLLIREEQRALLRDALQYAGLAESEKRCIQMTMEGFRQMEIVRELKIGENTVRCYLRRAILKIKEYAKRRDSQEE